MSENVLVKNIKLFGLKIRKASPEILLIAGVAGVVYSTVKACKATTKVNDILNQEKENLKQIEEVKNREDLEDVYTEEDEKKDIMLVKLQTGMNLVKLYAPSVMIGALSITTIAASHCILKKRTLAIGAAYVAIDRSFKNYRKRVRERFGEDVDRELLYGIQEKEIVETFVDCENGKTKKEKKKVNVVEDTNPLEESPYAKFFDEGCAAWEKDPEYNLMFLRAQQNYANDKLRADGFLFLNDVYKMLGIRPTKIGQVFGWVYKEGDPNFHNYVDFGIYETHRTANRDFVNGYEPVILLDFNVDGNILEYI